KVALIDDTSSRPKNQAIVVTDADGVVPNARRTAAAATMPAVSQRNRTGSAVQAALSLPIAALGVTPFQTVLGDLAIERGAAGLEDRGRRLLVPPGRVEHTQDVRPLGGA